MKGAKVTSVLSALPIFFFLLIGLSGVGMAGEKKADPLVQAQEIIHAGEKWVSAEMVSTTGATNGLDYISFSYKGSSGLLGFSSGYVYAVDDHYGFSTDGLDRQNYFVNQVAEQSKSLYVGVDVGRSFSLADDIVLGMRAGVIYLEDIYEDDGSLSVLFVIPVAIKNNVTIAPKFHWARPLPPESLTGENSVDVTDIKEGHLGSFYGGLSISLAY